MSSYKPTRHNGRMKIQCFCAKKIKKNQLIGLQIYTCKQCLQLATNITKQIIKSKNAKLYARIAVLRAPAPHLFSNCEKYMYKNN